MNYWPLAGIAIVVLGFALRFNPLLVVVTSALATGVLAGFDLIAVIEALGKAFNDNRYISVTWIILPVIGLLERHGLQQRARAVIAEMRGATMGKLLSSTFSTVASAATGAASSVSSGVQRCGVAC